MTTEDILLLGDPRLYEKCTEITKLEIEQIPAWVTQLHSVLLDAQNKYGFGRAIAAPQIGIMKRMIYLNIDLPLVLINPVFHNASNEMMELWDDCLSFPGLHVKVKRHRKIAITFKNEKWEEKEMALEDSLSELLQHEVDHLDGILSTMRAIDNKSFKMIKTT